MRTSREWIERTVDDLDWSVPTAMAAETCGQRVRPSTREALARTFEITLSEEEARALDAICREDELTPKQAVAHIVRARLLLRPQFGRGDRARLRACVELLRAMEQHVGRAARPVSALKPTMASMEACAEELLELGVYLRRIGRAIGESMLGNLDYWRGAPAMTLDEASRGDAQSCRTAGGGGNAEGVPAPRSERIVAEAGEDHVG